MFQNWWERRSVAICHHALHVPTCVLCVLSSACPVRAYTPQGYKTPSAEKARPLRAATTTPTSAQLSSSAPKALYGRSRQSTWLTDDVALSPSSAAKTSSSDNRDKKYVGSHVDEGGPVGQNVICPKHYIKRNFFFLQARGRKLQERFWATTSPSIAEGPAFSTPHLQKHHRRRPEETDHHGQSRRHATKGSGEEPFRPPRREQLGCDEPISPASPFQSPRRPLQRTFSDESLCSGRREASFANADDPGSPSDVLFTATLPTRRHAVSNQIQAKKSELSCRFARVDSFCCSCSSLQMLHSPLLLCSQCPCQPLSCLSRKCETKSPH